MVNYREILRLNSLNYSAHQIAASVHSSRNTIREVLRIANSLGMKWPLDDAVTNDELRGIFNPDRSVTVNSRKAPDYSYIHKELARPGVNLTLLWSEYCETCRAEGAIPYMYTQFCDKYRKWARITKATMRIRHKPGDVMQVDWAGNTLDIHDPATGEISDAYLFIAVLPCSCLAYAEVCADMKTETWVLCHIHAYNYFGGVARLLIPDNLKTGILKNTRYDTVLNRSYQEMAEYYNTAIVPARIDHPRDKSLAEGSVKYASTWILAALRNQKFFSIREAKEAVSQKLEELNNYPFKKREGNRRLAFDNEEKEFMQLLPITPFEPAVWSTATVQQDYLITDGKNKYSVPFDLIGEEVNIRVTRNTVEVFFHGNRVASHPRHVKAEHNPIIVKEHMPPKHRKYLSYNKDDFLSWGRSIGSNTESVISFYLNSGREPEQGYKFCASMMKLSDRYGHKRLEDACARAKAYSSQPSVRIINTILKNGQDKLPHEGIPSKEPAIKSHGITRGARYFGKEGELK